MEIVSVQAGAAAMVRVIRGEEKPLGLNLTPSRSFFGAVPRWDAAYGRAGGQLFRYAAWPKAEYKES